jgi:hypothetical protein
VIKCDVVMEEDTQEEAAKEHTTVGGNDMEENQGAVS